MIKKVFLTKNAFRMVIQNLLEIEEGINHLDEYFQNQYQDINEVKQLLMEYISHCNNIIKNTTTVETANNDFPYVIIGSDVIIEDTQSLEKFNYRLISPFMKKQISTEEISFLSPVGKALLLKQIDDKCHVKAPGGNFTYKILSIKINGNTAT